MKKKTLRLVGIVLALAVLILIFRPVILKGVVLLINKINPVGRLVSQLQADNRTLLKLNANNLVERDSLNAALQQAQTLTTTKEQELRGALARASRLVGEEANLSGIVDSLNAEIRSITEGSADVTIADSGLLEGGGYEDDWLSLRLLGDTLTYEFGFVLGNVEVELQEEGNNVRTIYSVWLQSKKTSGVRKYLGNYALTQTVAKPRIRAWDWWDPRAMLFLQVMEQAQASFGLALCSYNPAPQWGEDGNLLRFPILSLVSDINNDHRLGAMVSMNVGYFTPIFQNLHVATGYSYGVLGGGSGVVVGLGAAL